MSVTAANRFRFGRWWLASTAVLLRLGEFADRVLQRDEELAAEISNTLTEANASRFTPCTDQDTALLRRLTYASRFLKDVARLEDNKFQCSATSGKIALALPLLKPDVTTPSGATIYIKYPLKVLGGDVAEVVTFRRSDVVVSPDVFSDFPSAPIAYVVGVPDNSFLDVANPGHIKTDRLKAGPSQTAVITGVTGMVTVPGAVLSSQKALLLGDTLYRSRCSANFPLCAVTSIRMTDVWQANRMLMGGYLATGGAAGMSCATVLLAAGRKRRSHSVQLKRAILLGKLSVVYQPIVELGSHRIVGAEALARWTDEEGDSIRPETIVALAEAEGFVSEITRFVLTRAMSEIGPLLESHPHFRLSFNMAPSDLADPRLLLLLDERLQDARVTPANIAFELPERATSNREVAVAAIARLRERGHAVFIDDFGTGYSNLAYLTELNVDGIKINRSFIATIGTDSVTASIVPQILAVARALSLKVVVQGVEREEQARYFASGDPRILGQGWFFGLPVPARSLMYLCAEKSE
jgi:sensor c-di-GMP phosphodiesterase-like protein